MKLGKLPVGTPVPLVVCFSPDDHAALVRYTDLYEETYGDEATPAGLVPFIVRAFLQKDPDFERVRWTAPTPREAPVSPPPDAAQADRLLTVGDVLAMTGYRSRTTLWRKVSAGSFPLPRKHGRGAVRWRASDIQRWIDKLPEHAYGP